MFNTIANWCREVWNKQDLFEKRTTIILIPSYIFVVILGVATVCGLPVGVTTLATIFGAIQAAWSGWWLGPDVWRWVGRHINTQSNHAEREPESQRNLDGQGLGTATLRD